MHGLGIRKSLSILYVALRKKYNRNEPALWEGGDSEIGAEPDNIIGREAKGFSNNITYIIDPTSAYLHKALQLLVACLIPNLCFAQDVSGM